MFRKIVLAIMFLGVTACAGIMSKEDPVLVSKIDSYYSNAVSKSYKDSGLFSPQEFAVGQYVVAGLTDKDGRSISKMSIVGQEQGGWIIEQYSLTPTSEATVQMLVTGFEAGINGGEIDGMEFLWVKTKDEGQPVQTIDGAMLKMMRGFYKPMLNNIAVKTTGYTQDDTVIAPAGEFKSTSKISGESTFFGKTYRSTSWCHPAVPINGVVKMVHDNGSMELLEFGNSGAVRSF